MQIAKVVGTVVATKKEGRMDGLKLLLVQPADVEGVSKGGVICAIDSVGAGIDEIVLLASGSSARLTDVTQNKPVDAVIIAIVDTMDVEGKTRYSKSSSNE
ncbi:MAG: EutN/CcmL family microcompartment protein [Oligoflexia bacterium]|nr:EutN/CcmL family microcompartment protein [Oligoflexia bacterium]